MTNPIVEDGKERAATANRLHERQAEAAAAVRKRYRSRLASARGLRRFSEWLNMRKEIRAAKRKLEEELASGKALYLQQHEGTEKTR